MLLEHLENHMCSKRKKKDSILNELKKELPFKLNKENKIVLLKPFWLSKETQMLRKNDNGGKTQTKWIEGDLKKKME